MPYFRKKPVEIEAIQLTRDAFREAVDFIAASLGGASVETDGRVHLTIRTLEGSMCAEEGDWIIKGFKGEFYPCKPDIFAATYEAVDKDN